MRYFADVEAQRAYYKVIKGGLPLEYLLSDYELRLSCRAICPDDGGAIWII